VVRSSSQPPTQDAQGTVKRFSAFFTFERTEGTYRFARELVEYQNGKSWISQGGKVHGSANV
jgi:hypothetical protein